MNKNSYEMRYIQRLDYKTSITGWWVRFYINGKLTNGVTFKDSNYAGGKEEALSHAKKWRDAEDSRLIKAGFKREWKQSHVLPMHVKGTRTNNTSGTNGVFYKKIQCRDKKIPVYQAYWVEYAKVKGKIRKKSRYKSFSINKYGDDAYKKAREYRLTIIKKLENDQNHIKLRNLYITKRNLIYKG